MLLLICGWIIVIGFGTIIGAAVFPVDVLHRPGDRAIAAVWLGLVLLAVGALALSLVTALTPPVTSLAAAIVLTTCLISQRTRFRLGSVLRCVSPPALVALATLALGISAFGSQRRSWGDVGLYHAQAIGWLSDFGTVPGLALIHNRFGSGSSWFALAAIFDHGPFNGRADPLLGGLVLLLLCLHVVLAASRLLRGHARLADRFILAAALLLLPYLSGKVAVSPSPDAAVAALAALTAWLFLVVADRTADQDRGASSRVDAAVLPLVLGVGAVTMKLSALPIAAAAAFHYFLRMRDGSPARPAIAIGTSVLLLLPLLGANTVLSGCPLFPSERVCIDVPWTIDSGRSNYASVVQESSRWYGHPPDQTSFPALVRRWIAINDTIIVMIAGSVVCLLIGVRARERRYRSGVRGVIALFLFGVPFVLWLAPLSRFLVGYAVVVPALFVAARTERVSASRAHGLRLRSKWSPVAPAALLCALIVARSPLLNVVTPLKHAMLGAVFVTDRVQLVAPRALPFDPPVTVHSVNDLKYTVPLFKNRCWSAPPPCTPALTRPDVGLRRPEAGIRAGFRRGVSLEHESRVKPAAL